VLSLRPPGRVVFLGWSFPGFPPGLFSDVPLGLSNAAAGLLGVIGDFRRPVRDEERKNDFLGRVANWNKQVR